MSELRFTCPACGQHMQCEKSFCGDKTICPSCSAELRIPFSTTPPEPKTLLPRAELILKPEEAAALTGELKKKVVDDNPFGHSDIPVQVGTSAQKPETAKPPVTADDHSLHCVCPVCHSELKVAPDTATASSGVVPVAEVVPKESTSAAGEKPSPTPNTEVPPVVERERQIAVAREAHQVSLYPAMKPRLAYVLNGEHPANPHPSSPPPEEPPPDVKTLHE